MGLQISFGVDNEVPLPGAGRGRWPAGERIAEGDIPKHGDDNLCGVDQSRPRTHADWNTAKRLGVEGSAISEREKLTQIADGISGSEEKVLGSASVGQRILGRIEWQRYG